MEWTREQKLEALMRLPWTIRVERDEEDGCFVARVGEIPSAIATGDDEASLEREMWESLRASLEVHLDNDDDIPLPQRAPTLPWERRAVVHVRTVKAVHRRGDLWDTVAVAETAMIEGPPVELAPAS